MTNIPENGNGIPTRRGLRFKKSYLWKAGVPLLVIITLFKVLGGGSETQAQGAVVAVKQGPLKITVLEGGTIEAREFQEIKSQVKGQTKIISIVEEGYSVTEEDVANSKVLVELDSADMKQDMIRQKIEFQGTLASLTNAQAQYEITLKQNESDITAAELSVKFKRIDFEKYLGAEVAQGFLKSLAIDPTGEEELDEATLQKRQSKRAAMDFSALANNPKLEGDAKQKRSKLQSDYQLAAEDLLIAEQGLKWTKELADKDFATSTELQQDEMKVKRSTVTQESSLTAEQLFILYEFPKEAEKLLSDYEEAIRMLVRTRKQAVSKLAQADAQLKASEARYELESQRQTELQEQIDNCAIKAQRVGLVVYGANEQRWGGDDQIKEGAMVRERQSIITIPDIKQMSVKVKVHESSIKKVRRGQKAKATLDAFPDNTLTGEVTKVAVLPDSERRWMSPDMKVYSVTVSIDGTHEWLRPGMSAQVEILVNELPNVTYVPLLAVSEHEGRRVCYVANGLGTPERRAVETGDFSEEFIEIKSGLKVGESVLLLTPGGQEMEGTEAPEANENPEGEKGRQGEERPPAVAARGGVA